MKYEQKEKLIEKIRKTNNWDLLNEIEDIFNKNPVYITDFIKKLLLKEFGTGGTKEVYYNDYIIKALETNVRQIWIEIEDKIIIKRESKYAEGWYDLEVKQKNSTRYYYTDLDIWIQENCYLFNSIWLSEIIFNIWSEKVTFKK